MEQYLARAGPEQEEQGGNSSLLDITEKGRDLVTAEQPTIGSEKNENEQMVSKCHL